MGASSLGLLGKKNEPIRKDEKWKEIWGHSGSFSYLQSPKTRLSSLVSTHSALTAKVQPLGSNTQAYLFVIFGYAGSLFLPGLFSSCSSRGYSPVAVHRVLVAGLSLAVEHRR